jgi:hypothetical protein
VIAIKLKIVQKPDNKDLDVYTTPHGPMESVVSYALGHI